MPARLGCWLISLLAPILAFALFALFLIVTAVPQQANAWAQPCVATLANSSTTTPQPATLDPEQHRVASTIITIGQQQHLPPRAWQIALQAGKTESNLYNLPHGHATSLGVFQIQDMHGTTTQRLDLNWQVHWFYATLRNVHGWDHMRPGEAAQAVEKSAFPGRYDQHEPFAAQLLQNMAGITDPSGCHSSPRPGPGDNPWATKAVEAALSKQGAPYVWGAKGPAAFDCSGLIAWAYQQAGLAVPSYSPELYHAGKPIPVDQAQPGDLIFWADARGRPEAIHHVALALGNNEIIHAPQEGQPVQRTTIWRHELVPTAIRPGT